MGLCLPHRIVAIREASRPSEGGVTLGCVESVGCGVEAEMWCHVRE